MHFVGYSGDAWKYISDGHDVYMADHDVRFYSVPPSHRILKVALNVTEFLSFAAQHHIEIKRAKKVFEKMGERATPALVGGGLGALFFGPIGAAIGSGLGGLLGGSEERGENDLSKIFEKCVSDYASWQAYDVQQASAAEQKKIEYEMQAQRDWDFYFQLQSFSKLDSLDGASFEVAIKNLYEAFGYKATITKASGDYGVDIIAKRDTETLAIQAKRYSSPVGIKAIQEISSGSRFYKATQGIVITRLRTH